MTMTMVFGSYHVKHSQTHLKQYQYLFSEDIVIDENMVVCVIAVWLR